MRSPHLTWHHFDPPWRERKHHDPDGMIALCPLHHHHADAGAFTRDQLRALKTVDHGPGILGARFEWMRHELLTVVGGNFYFETPIAVQIQGTSVVWLRREDRIGLLLNVNMPTTSDRPRMVIVDNWWITRARMRPRSNARHMAAWSRPPTQTGIVCGSSFRVSGGRELRPAISDSELRSAELRVAGRVGGRFPITTVEVELNVAGSGISFGPRESRIGGVRITNSWAARCGAGIVIN